MNIEIANRLVQLRKSNNLSQEALAARLGISRQAVSKWERAEASPDTDNLILLARLYKVSLDDLLRTEEEISLPEEDYREESEESPKEEPEEAYEENSEGDPGEAYGGNYREEVPALDESWEGERKHYPVGWVILIAYLVIGCVFHAWHPGWLLVFLIPIWHSLVLAIEKRDAACFAYPVLVVLVYLFIGFFYSAWHPGWIIFLTIPLYYPFAVSYLNSMMRGQEENKKGSGGGRREKDGRCR